MKKNTEERDAELRTAILDQATKLFKIFGYHKLVMDDIARAVGKSRSTLYLYYKDKEAIFNAIIDKEIQAYIIRLSNDLPTHKTASDKLRAYIQTKYDFRHAKAAEYLMLTQEMIRQPEILAKMRVFSDPSEISLLTQIIELGIATGEFEPLTETQIGLTARAIISSLDGISTDLLASADRKDVVPVRELVSLLLVRSLERRAAK